MAPTIRWNHVTMAPPRGAPGTYRPVAYSPRQLRIQRRTSQGDDPAFGADDQSPIHPVAIRSPEGVLPADGTDAIDVCTHDVSVHYTGEPGMCAMTS